MKTFMLKQVPHNVFNSIMHNAAGLVMLFICLTGFGAYQAKAQNTQTFSSAGTFSFEVPNNVVRVTVECWGGGGRGGSAAFGEAGGGGGGGAYSKRINIPVISNQSYTVVVGAGGNNTVLNGGDSYFIDLTTVLAKGGNGVANSTATGASGGLSSQGVGDPGSVFNGGNGANGDDTFGGGYGGGGGSSAGTSANGTTATGQSGAVAPTGGGNGGAGGGLFQSGSNGIAPGGGGGGGRSSGGSGGLGAPGRVVITWEVCPSISASATKTDATCFENSDGQIVITASGGTGPYTYSIDNGNNYEISNTFSGLAQGEYRIRVKDANGCESPEIP